MATRRLVVEIVGDASSLERSFRRASSSSRGFESGLGKATRGAAAASLSFKGLGRSLTFASAQFLGGAGIVFAGKQIIDQASRVQEEIEKTGVVFGKNADEVQAWSKTLAQSFGISEGAALEATGKFGNMLAPLGFGTKAAADMSERLVELAADIASFNNAKPADVLAALSSGLAGQVRPLRQYGVFLTQARIQNEAVADGLSKTGKNMSQATKLQAAYNIILKDTKNAQGDVARNTESLSVAQSKLTAGIQDTEAGLGQALLPTLTDYLNKSAAWLNDTENQERIQHAFKTAIHDTGVVLHDIEAIVKTVTKVTGGLGNVLETIIALKVAKSVAGWANALGKIGGAATATKVGAVAGEVAVVGSASTVATAEVTGLRAALLGLGAPEVLLAIAAVGAALEASHLTQQLSAKVFGKGGFQSVGKTAAGQEINFKNGQFTAATFSGPQGFKLGGKISEEQAAKMLGITKAALEKRLGIIPQQQIIDALTLDPGKALGVTGKGGGATTPPKPLRLKGLTATQRNQFFDSAISSDLTRAGLLESVQGQIAALQRIAGLITARLAATKDVTRRRTLEDQLLQVQAQIRGDQKQAGQDFLSGLQLGFTKAQATTTFKDDLAALAALKAGIQAQIAATGDSVDLEGQLFDVTQQIKAVHAQVFQQRIDLAQFRVTKAESTPGFADDLKALKALEDGIRAQIKETGTTLDLQQQLFAVQQQIKAAKSSALSAKDFKLLGFGPTGEDIIPGKNRLKKELAAVQGLVAGTKFDTPKIRAQLATIGTLLTNALVPADVRAKMQELLSNLRKQLDGHLALLTKFQHQSSAKFAASIPGLTPAQTRAVRAAFAGVGAGGTVPTRGPAFAGAAARAKVPATTPPPKSSGSPRAPSTTYVLNNPQFHGVTDVAALESALAKRAGRRAPRRD